MSARRLAARAAKFGKLDAARLCDTGSRLGSIDISANMADQMTEEKLVARRAKFGEVVVLDEVDHMLPGTRDHGGAYHFLSFCVNTFF